MQQQIENRGATVMWPHTPPVIVLHMYSELWVHCLLSMGSYQGSPCSEHYELTWYSMQDQAGATNFQSPGMSTIASWPLFSSATKFNGREGWRERANSGTTHPMGSWATWKQWLRPELGPIKWQAHTTLCRSPGTLRGELRAHGAGATQAKRVRGTTASPHPLWIHPWQHAPK